MGIQGVCAFYLFIGMLCAAGTAGVAHKKKKSWTTSGRGLDAWDIVRGAPVIIVIVIAWPLVIAFLFGSGEIGGDG